MKNVFEHFHLPKVPNSRPILGVRNCVSLHTCAGYMTTIRQISFETLNIVALLCMKLISVF